MEKRQKAGALSPKQEASKNGPKKKPRRRKRAKPLKGQDSLRAVALAGTLILLAVLLLALVIYLISPGEGGPQAAAPSPPPENPARPTPAAPSPAPEKPVPPAAPQPAPPVRQPAPPVTAPRQTTPPPTAPRQAPPATPAPARQTAPPAAAPQQAPPATPAPARQTVPPTAAPRQAPAAPSSSPIPHSPFPIPQPSSIPHSPLPIPPPPKNRGTVVFVIDDAGNNLRELEPFLRFPGPLTIAVLPALPHSAEAARRIRAAGKEVFLHQPMEAAGGRYPGPGAVYAGMSPTEIRETIGRNLAEIGPVAGMNNHQGSLITENREIMEVVLALCREQGIYFLDSRTSAATTAPDAAKRLGIKIGERDIFLDNAPERSSIIGYLENGLALAERKGQAVMIGHTWTPELAPVLEEFYPKLLERGFTLAPFSRFMRGALP